MEPKHLGPVGGDSGRPFDGYDIPEDARLTAIHVFAEWVVDALRFDYVRAGSVKEALSLLAAGDGSKVIAGGHSLLPMMRFRLVQAPKLVDISLLAELKGVQEYKKGVRIGAATTYAELARSALLRERCPVVAEVAAEIADLQVRNRGTIGGSLAHADPASDMPAVMLALDAEFQVRSKKGGRRTAKARQAVVLRLMVKEGYITPQEADGLFRVVRDQRMAFLLVGAVNLGLGFVAFFGFDDLFTAYRPGFLDRFGAVGSDANAVAHNTLVLACSHVVMMSCLRSGWRGTMTVRRSGNFSFSFWCTRQAIDSSPLCELA